MSDKQPIRPSAWYYVLCAVVILSGMSFFVYTLFHGVSHITDNLVQVVVPGAKDLNLQPKLWYTIFLEEGAVVDGRVYATKLDLAELKCTVTSQATGEQSVMRFATGSTTYNLNGRSGRSVLEFMTEEAGVYHLECNYEEGAQGPQGVLAVGSGVTQEILGILMKCFASLVGGVILGGVVFATVYVKRQREKRRIAQAPLEPVS